MIDYACSVRNSVMQEEYDWFIIETVQLFLKDDPASVHEIRQRLRRWSMVNSFEFRDNVFYRHFDLPTQFPVIGLLGDHWQVKPMEVTRLHFHNCLEIGYLQEGNGVFYFDDREVHFQTPCLVLAPPNVPHVHNIDGDYPNRWKWIYVDPAALLEHLSPRLIGRIGEYQRSLSSEICVLTAEEYPQIFSIASMIVEEMENAQQHHHHIVRELFGALFLMLLRTFPDTAQTDDNASSRLGCLTPAIVYITENYMNNISIDQLAQMCHVSTSHFRRLFKKALGWSPLDYLQIIRIDHACKLLYNCELSITEVSMRVGYPSASSFNRQFHRIHGISPNQWRQKVRSEENPTVTAYLDSLPPSVL